MASDSDPNVGIGMEIGSGGVIADGFATVQELAEFLMQLGITASTWPDVDLLQRHINLSASEIKVALQTSNQLGCSLSAGGTDFLRLINLISAMLIMEFPNVRSQISTDSINRFQTWKDTNINSLTKGDKQVCTGHTGENFPAIATAEIGWNEWVASDIIINSLLRGST